jgi:uncharacterized glyoxalase superfamily protein PhnB
LEVNMTKATNSIPKGHHTVTPSLTLDNAALAIDWYKKALGAEETARVVGPDGKLKVSFASCSPRFLSARRT